MDVNQDPPPAHPLLFNGYLSLIYTVMVHNQNPFLHPPQHPRPARGMAGMALPSPQLPFRNIITIHSAQGTTHSPAPACRDITNRLLVSTDRRDDRPGDHLVRLPGAFLIISNDIKELKILSQHNKKKTFPRPARPDQPVVTTGPPCQALSIFLSAHSLQPGQRTGSQNLSASPTRASFFHGSHSGNFA